MAEQVSASISLVQYQTLQVQRIEQECIALLPNLTVLMHHSATLQDQLTVILFVDARHQAVHTRFEKELTLICYKVVLKLASTGCVRQIQT